MKHVSTGKGKGEQDHTAGATGASQARSRSPEAKPSLQSALGNREFAGLFRETVGPRNDSFEREADQAARSIASAGSVPGIGLSSSPGGIQRKCAGCEHEEEEKIRRAPKDDASETAAAAPEAAAAPAQEEAAATKPEQAEPAAQPEAAAAPSLLVEDTDAPGLGQMGKTQFLAALRGQVTATADDALAGTGQTSEGCPWIDYWLGYYADQSASHVERALRRYAPETAGAASASDYFGAVTARIRRSVLIWSKTGQVTGVPEDLPGAGAASVLSTAGGMFFKARPGGPKNANPASVRDQLGSGGPLPGGVRSRMESAFGSNFGGVRLHTDGQAAQLSDQLNARAFTVGEHVAFGSGEYHPGTIAGDALMAHELAHVVQQGGAEQARPMGKSPESTGPLEQDADRAAVGAVASLWGGVKGGLANLGPSLKSGLQLSRCSTKSEKLQVHMRPIRVAEDDGTASTTVPSLDAAKRIWKQCCIDVEIDAETTVKETDYKELEDGGSGAALTAEETALFAAAGGGAGVVQLAIVDTIKRGTTAGKDVAGGATTKDSGLASAKVIAVDGTDPTVIAHELGHAMGYAKHGPAGTVMQPSGAHDKAVDEAVNSDICTAARGYTSASATGKKDCEMKT